MTPYKPVRRIAIVGAGVIGASWAAQYLACGLDVRNRPSPELGGEFTQIRWRSVAGAH